MEGDGRSGAAVSRVVAGDAERAAPHAVGLEARGEERRVAVKGAAALVIPAEVDDVAHETGLLAGIVRGMAGDAGDRLDVVRPEERSSAATTRRVERPERVAALELGERTGGIPVPYGSRRSWRLGPTPPDRALRRWPSQNRHGRSRATPGSGRAVSARRGRGRRHPRRS